MNFNDALSSLNEINYNDIEAQVRKIQDEIGQNTFDNVGVTNQLVLGGAQLQEQSPSFASTTKSIDGITTETDTIIGSQDDISFSSFSSDENLVAPTEHDVVDNVNVSDLSSKNHLPDDLVACEETKRFLHLLLLTPGEQQIVDGAIRGIGPEGEILAKQDSDSVQRGSMQTLSPGQWLNDEVINYFLKNCLATRDEILCTKQPGRKRSHFFNSFFVQTMFDEKNNNMNVRGKYNYKNVRRWGKKVPGKDIFNLKYIICPINLDNEHWTCVVIFMEEKKIKFYDSDSERKWFNQKYFVGLLQYLEDEWKAKDMGCELDVSDWKSVNCTCDTPQQENGKFS